MICSTGLFFKAKFTAKKKTICCYSATTSHSSFKGNVSTTMLQLSLQPSGLKLLRVRSL